MELKIDHNYFYQVQGQMHISKRKFCYFVVYTKNRIEIQTVNYDESFWNKKMIDKLKMYVLKILYFNFRDSMTFMFCSLYVLGTFFFKVFTWNAYYQK